MFYDVEKEFFCNKAILRLLNCRVRSQKSAFGNDSLESVHLRLDRILVVKRVYNSIKNYCRLNQTSLHLSMNIWMNSHVIYCFGNAHTVGTFVRHNFNKPVCFSFLGSGHAIAIPFFTNKIRQKLQ
jgi:hypothetical protein